MKIIVNTIEDKIALLKESEYVHDLGYLDSDKCNTLAHIYMNPDMIVVKKDSNNENDTP